MSDRPGIDVVYQENRALEAEIERLRKRIGELERQRSMLRSHLLDLAHALEANDE